MLSAGPHLPNGKRPRYDAARTWAVRRTSHKPSTHPPCDSRSVMNFASIVECARNSGESAGDELECALLSIF
jgi:hypothetical protein